jgi:hypothetical protein
VVHPNDAVKELFTLLQQQQAHHQSQEDTDVYETNTRLILLCDSIAFRFFFSFSAITYNSSAYLGFCFKRVFLFFFFTCFVIHVSLC